MVRGIVGSRGPQPELVDAVRPDLHRTHIALLAQSRSGEVREAVARRDDVPFGVQAALSNDDLHGVRAAIAANPRAAVSVMHLLAVDSHHAVLLALAGNPSAPRDVAERLANHRRADIRKAAIRRLEMRDATPFAEAVDPDSRIPELRDRVAAPVEAEGRRGVEVSAREAGLHVAVSMSRLAQHVGSRQVQRGVAVGSHAVAPVGAPSFAAS
jgi:hypothetical protein